MSLLVEMRRIIPSITTMTPGGWRSKLDEVVRFRLSEVALFVTGISPEEREECFAALKSAHRKHRFTIPFVHAVSSMSERDYRFLMDTFGTEAFNLHPREEFPLQWPLSETLRRRIFIENTIIDQPIPEVDLRDFGGICFDLSHLEDSRRSCPENYLRLLELRKRFPVGANHISAVKFEPRAVTAKGAYYSVHESNDRREMAYPMNLDPASFASLCAIELENSIEEQLSFIPYVAEAMSLAEGEAEKRAA